MNRETNRLENVEAVYSQARSGHIELWSSALCIVEANRLSPELNLPKPIAPESLKVLDEVFFQPFVKLIPLDIDIARLARKLVRETPGLGKKADAIHLAAAIRWNMPIFHTYDNDDLLHLNGKIICADGLTMEICEPYDPNSGGLFDNASKPAA